MSKSSMDDLVVLGHVGAAYGIKGWVKIVSHTDPKEGIFEYGQWLIKQGQQWQSVKIAAAKQHGKGLIAQLEGCNDRNAAERLRNAEIAITRTQLPELEEGEFYWNQLEGLKVIAEDEAGQAVLLGRVSHLMATGANDVLVVKGCAGSIDKRERLLPFLIDQVVTEVNLEAGELKVDWDPEF